MKQLLLIALVTILPFAGYSQLSLIEYNNIFQALGNDGSVGSAFKKTDDISEHIGNVTAAHCFVYRKSDNKCVAALITYSDKDGNSYLVIPDERSDRNVLDAALNDCTESFECKFLGDDKVVLYTIWRGYTEAVKLMSK